MYVVLEICIRKDLDEKSISIKFYTKFDSALKHIMDEVLKYARETKSIILDKNNSILTFYEQKIEKYLNNNKPIWLPVCNDDNLSYTKKKDGDLLQLFSVDNQNDIILDQSTIGVNSIDDLIDKESNEIISIIKE